MGLGRKAPKVKNVVKIAEFCTIGAIVYINQSQIWHVTVYHGSNPAQQILP